MANWKDSIGKVTQSAISKSKEVAEITRLNMEISTLTQKVKDLYSQAGERVLEAGLAADDPVIADLASQLATLKQSIQMNRDKLNEVKNVNICPNCGAEISRTSRFCDKCGTEIIKAPQEPPMGVCKVCGSPIEKDALFCGNCGAKQEQGQGQTQEQVQGLAQGQRQTQAQGQVQEQAQGLAQEQRQEQAQGQEQEQGQGQAQEQVQGLAQEQRQEQAQGQVQVQEQAR